MKIMKIARLAVMSALTAVLVFQISVTPVAAENSGSQDSSRKSRLRIYFERYAGPAVPDFGDQFTITGGVARFETPGQRTGAFAIHFVATAQYAAETMLDGVI